MNPKKHKKLFYERYLYDWFIFDDKIRQHKELCRMSHEEANAKGWGTAGAKREADEIEQEWECRYQQMCAEYKSKQKKKSAGASLARAKSRWIKEQHLLMIGL